MNWWTKLKQTPNITKPKVFATTVLGKLPKLLTCWEVVLVQLLCSLMFFNFIASSFRRGGHRQHGLSLCPFDGFFWNLRLAAKNHLVMPPQRAAVEKQQKGSHACHWFEKKNEKNPQKVFYHFMDGFWRKLLMLEAFKQSIILIHRNVSLEPRPLFQSQLAQLGQFGPTITKNKSKKRLGGEIKWRLLFSRIF